MNGTIKKITDRGFGFIAADGGRELFFHSNALVGVSFDELHEGDNVTFDTEDTAKGPAAVNVQRV
jgi:CspA family cold shock protein